MTGKPRMRASVIAPIVVHPPHSAERREAFAAILGVKHIAPDGRTLILPESTLCRWAGLHDANGIASYARRAAGAPSFGIFKPRA